MKMEMIIKLIYSILVVLYEQTGFALILAMLFMYMFLFAREYGWKQALRTYWVEFSQNKVFRRMFFLVFYFSMLFFRTLLNRDMWLNPLNDIMGGWGLYNMERELTTEAIENVILFIPAISLLYWNFHNKIFLNKFILWAVVWKSFLISFVSSLGIEFCQLFFRVGTFQLADLCYNTVGGLIGGLVYWGGYKIINRKK